MDEVIKPEDTRPKVIRALEMLRTKRQENPPKKHGNIRCERGAEGRPPRVREVERRAGAPVILSDGRLLGARARLGDGAERASARPARAR